MTARADVNRRRFLATIGLGGAAAVAAVASRKSGEAPRQAAGEPRSAGYRLTEHIRKYYETARV
jgi:hypothetical protein